jgi:hypothetical protein
MVERKIIWTEKAKNSLFLILDFYENQNGNNIYSEKLFSELIEKSNLLANYTFLGKKNEYLEIRELVIDRNSLFYTETKDTINIILVWDNRRNPSECYDLLKNK